MVHRLGVYSLVLTTGALAPAVAAQTDCPETIPEPVYKRMIARQFASIANPKTPVNVASFGAYESKDGQITFSGSSVFKSGRVLTLKASGSGSDGVLPFLKGDELHSKVALDVQLHSLSRGTSLGYSYLSCAESARAARKALDDYYKRHITLSHGVAATTARLRLDRLKRDTTARGVEIRRRTATLARASAADRVRLDSLWAAQIFAIDSLHLTALDTLPPTGAELLAHGNQLATDSAKAWAGLDVRGYRIGWWALGFSVERNAFKRFDSTAAFDAQFTNATSTGASVRAHYSMLSHSQDPLKSWYFSVGMKAALTDNFAKLKKVELIDTRQFGPAERDRERTTKTTAYTGDHMTGIGTVSVLMDWYHFVLGDMAAAVHMYPSVLATEKEKPITSIGFGFLALYKNSDNKPVVNAELYYELEDVWHVAHDNSLRDRRTIGFRFTVPLTFTAKE